MRDKNYLSTHHSSLSIILSQMDHFFLLILVQAFLSELCYSFHHRNTIMNKYTLSYTNTRSNLFIFCLKSSDQSLKEETNNEIINQSDGINNIKSATLSELFSQIKDLDDNDIPENVMNEINNRIKENAPTEFEMRMQFLGITPLTKAGFLLSGILIFLNTILGNGWLGDLFGMNNENSLIIVKESNNNNKNEVDKEMMKFDYKKFRNNLDEITLDNSNNKINIIEN